MLKWLYSVQSVRSCGTIWNDRVEFEIESSPPQMSFKILYSTLFPTYSISQRCEKRFGTTKREIRLVNSISKSLAKRNNENFFLAVVFEPMHHYVFRLDPSSETRPRDVNECKSTKFPYITSVGIEIRCKPMNKSNWERCTLHSNCFGSRKPMKFSPSKWRTCP